MKTNKNERCENKISLRVGGTQCPLPIPPLKLAIRMLYSIVLIIIPVMVVIPKTF